MSARYDICQCGALDHLDKHGLCLECSVALTPDDTTGAEVEAPRDAQTEASA